MDVPRQTDRSSISRTACGAGAREPVDGEALPGGEGAHGHGTGALVHHASGARKVRDASFNHRLGNEDTCSTHDACAVVCVCGRLLNRESMPDFFAATTRSMAPEGTDGNEAGCIVEVRVRPHLLILCFNRWGMSFAQRPIRMLGSVVKACLLIPCPHALPLHPQARNRSGQFMRCLVTMRWSWTSVSAVFGVRFWPLEALMSDRPPAYAPQYYAPRVGLDAQAPGYPWIVPPVHVGADQWGSSWDTKVSEAPSRELQVSIPPSGGIWESVRQEEVVLPSGTPWQYGGQPVPGPQVQDDGERGAEEDGGEEWELCSGGLLDSPLRLGEAVADEVAFLEGTLPEAVVGGSSSQADVDAWQQPTIWNG